MSKSRYTPRLHRFTRLKYPSLTHATQAALWWLYTLHTHIHNQGSICENLWTLRYANPAPREMVMTSSGVCRYEGSCRLALLYYVMTSPWCYFRVPAGQLQPSTGNRIRNTMITCKTESFRQIFQCRVNLYKQYSRIGSSLLYWKNLGTLKGHWTHKKIFNYGNRS